MISLDIEVITVLGSSRFWKTLLLLFVLYIVQRIYYEHAGKTIELNKSD